MLRMPAADPLPPFPLPREEALSQLPDIAGPHRDEDVPRAEPFEDRIPRLSGLPRVEGLLVPVPPDPLAQPFPRGPLHRLLPGGVDVENQQRVRVVESREEIPEQRLGPRVPVRLEPDDDPPCRPHLARC